jgi:muramoyltetrapeptide carboxypeptidase
MQRRAFGLAMAGLAVLSALGDEARAGKPAPGTAARPPRLRKGARVAVIAPASATFERLELEYAGDVLRALGLEPRFGEHTAHRYGYLAGEDAQRAADVNGAFGDASIEAVFALRGGWGSGRMLPLLDYPLIARNPKLLIGYSDITALLLAVQAKCGLTGVHGPNLLSDWNPYVVDLLRRLLFEGERVEYRPWKPETDSLATMQGRIQTLVPGVAEGRLVGGNLTVLATLVGTPYLPDLRGCLLFLEDVHEAVYRIDRALMQLRLAGLLEQVAGIVFGGFSDVPPDPGYGSFTLDEVLEQHCRAVNKPAFLGAAFGHVAQNSPLPLGVRARMDAASGVVRLLEPAVS